MPYLYIQRDYKLLRNVKLVNDPNRTNRYDTRTHKCAEKTHKLKNKQSRTDVQINEISLMLGTIYSGAASSTDDKVFDTYFPRHYPYISGKRPPSAILDRLPSHPVLQEWTY